IVRRLTSIKGGAASWADAIRQTSGPRDMLTHDSPIEGRGDELAAQSLAELDSAPGRGGEELVEAFDRLSLEQREMRHRFKNELQILASVARHAARDENAT